MNCASCALPLGSNHRFCTNCGTPVAERCCDQCNQPVQNGSRLCTSCSTRTESCQGDDSLAPLALSLQLSLQVGDPSVILAQATAFLAKPLNPEYGALACLVAMTAEAQLSHPKQARGYARQAREFYAEHLGLNPSQKVRYTASGLLIDDLREVGSEAFREEPWIYFLLGHSCGPHIPEDDSISIETCEEWREFLSERAEETLRALAQVLFAQGEYMEAAERLQDVILLARRYEMISPLRVEVVWPRFLLGECHRAAGRNDRAIDLWRSACSIEHCIEGSPNDTDNAGLRWSTRAKERLAERQASYATQSASRSASRYIVQAVRYLTQAESYEARDDSIDVLLDSVRKAGDHYSALLARASEEITMMDRYDPFAFGKAPIGDSTSWFRLESAKEQLLQKNALVYLSKEQTAAAVVCYKQSTELWPTVSGYSTLAALQLACGLRSDAKASCEMLIHRAMYIGSTEASEDHQEKLSDAYHLIRELG